MTLPRHAPDPEARAADIAAMREVFVHDREALPGLVLCRGVPLEVVPTFTWIRRAGQRATEALLNLLANAVAWHARVGESPAGNSPGQMIDAAVVREAELMARAWSRLLEAADDWDQDAAAEALRELGLDPRAPMERVLRQWAQSVIDMVFRGLAAPLAIFEEKSDWYAYGYGIPQGRPGGIASIRALYRTLPRPAAVLPTDADFARRRLTGPNPSHLQRLGAMPAGLKVDDGVLAAATTASDTWATALAEGRVFAVDYAALDALEPAGEGRLGTKYIYTPVAVFAVPPGGGRLAPVAIQCEPQQGGPVFTPADGWSWVMARHTVDVADMAHFEVGAHLGLTHLLMEAVALATHRALADTHPVARLLQPHLEGTIAVNQAAVEHLLADGGAVDQTFGATIASTRALAVEVVRGNDFRAMVPATRFARNGTTGTITEYPYRDDALLVWSAIASWVGAYVEHVYPDEAELAADPELAAWLATLGGPVDEGGLAGFGSVRDRAELAEVLTLMVFTASARHAAVNFPQWTDCGYAPAMSGAGWAPPPRRVGGHTRDDWLAMLPPLEMCALQAEFLYVLGHTYHTPLGDYGRAGDEARSVFSDPVVRDTLVPRFQAALAAVSKVIEARNATRSVPYPHLLPGRIPRSVNV